jgi:RNA polymerase sigma factor (sigma-70 family)
MVTDDSTIFAELHPALRRFAGAVRPIGIDADDLVQEALARTLRRTSLGDLDDALMYLRRVVVNLATSHRRSVIRRSAIRARAGRDEVDAVDRYGSDLADLMRVPPDQRAVLYLYIVDGASHPEIAELLHITPEASRARLSRGLRLLRVELTEEESLP